MTHKSQYPLYLWTAYGMHPTPEHRFHPSRGWRFDFAWQEQLLAVEIDGGLFQSGAHSQGAGILKDMEKLNEAGRLGWRVFRFTPRDLKKGLAQAFMLTVLEGKFR